MRKKTRNKNGKKRKKKKCFFFFPKQTQKRRQVQLRDKTGCVIIIGAAMVARKNCIKLLSSDCDARCKHQTRSRDIISETYVDNN